MSRHPAVPVPFFIPLPAAMLHRSPLSLMHLLPALRIFLVSLIALGAASAAAPGTRSVARDPYLSAIVVDAATGRVLFEDNADATAYPASVLKLMDLLLVLESVKEGRLSLQDAVTVSAKAANPGGAMAGLRQGESFPLDELLYAMMIHSANDAAIAIAEKVAGSVEHFIARMNERARSLGMKATDFHSVNGLAPAADGGRDVTTARDLSLLAQELLKHDAALRYTSARERTFRPDGGRAKLTMRSHNPLLGKVPGCDGLKTGYIAAAGYCIAATAERNGKRVIVILLGCLKEETRAAKAAELIEKGFELQGAPVRKE